MKLRTVIKIILTVGFFGARIGLPGGTAHAQGDAQYFSTRSVLSAFFPKSERVTYRTLVLDADSRPRVARRLGYTPALDRYTVFVAMTQGRVDGYAVIDDEKGLHQPITFATKISPLGVVEGVEIMVYREPRGDEVRDPRFRKQFEGRTARDEMRIAHDIDAVSGATISSASLAVGVRRATILVDELMSAKAGPAKGTIASAPPAGSYR